MAAARGHRSRHRGRRRHRRRCRRPADAAISRLLRQLHRERPRLPPKGRGALIRGARRVCEGLAAAARCPRHHRHRHRPGGGCVIGVPQLRDALRRLLPRAAPS